LQASIQAATPARAAALVAKCPARRTSDSRVECHDSMTALSSADPGRPIDWEMDSRAQARRNRPAVYSAALIGVHDDAGHQRAEGQLRVVMLAQGEPHDPA
jgi:hypothetical protein